MHHIEAVVVIRLKGAYSNMHPAVHSSHYSVHSIYAQFEVGFRNNLRGITIIYLVIGQRDLTKQSRLNINTS